MTEYIKAITFKNTIVVINNNGTDYIERVTKDNKKMEETNGLQCKLSREK